MVNLINPGAQGMVLSASVPDTDFHNSSASFANNVPTYICQNDLFNFNHSALDSDGDSTVCRLMTPYTAGSQTDSFPTATAPPYSYQPLNWGPSYGNGNYMDGEPALTIDSLTGQLNVRPKQLGQYVFGIAVTEYRDGVRLTELR